MKSFICLLTCLLFLFSLSACVPQTTVEPAETLAPSQVVNPVRYVDGPEAFTNDLRFYMIPPEGAQECQYSLIFGEIAQIQFVHEDTAYTLRGTYKEGDNSGVYGPFEETEEISLLDHPYGSCEVRTRHTTDGGAVANWTLFDIHFSLSASQIDLPNAFNALAANISSRQLDLNYEHTVTNRKQQLLEMGCDSPITITSKGETYIPYASWAYSMFWDGQNMICADGGADMAELDRLCMLPLIPYSEDFALTLDESTQLSTIVLFNSNLNQLDGPWDLDSFSRLEPGVYYVEVVVHQDGEYIPEADETEYSGIACYFILTVE